MKTPPPIDDIIKALLEAGQSETEIASTIAKMFGGVDNAATKVDEVLPKIASGSSEVIPKLVPEGEALPAAAKISTAAKTPKFVRPQFDDAVHAKTTQKFSDIMTPEEFAAAKDADLKYIRNSQLNAAENEERRVAGRSAKAEKKAANQAKHAATRTPEARRAAAAKQKEYFDKLKKGDK